MVERQRIQRKIERGRIIVNHQRRLDTGQKTKQRFNMGLAVTPVSGTKPEFHRRVTCRLLERSHGFRGKRGASQSGMQDDACGIDYPP